MLHFLFILNVHYLIGKLIVAHFNAILMLHFKVKQSLYSQQKETTPQPGKFHLTRNLIGQFEKINFSNMVKLQMCQPALYLSWLSRFRPYSVQWFVILMLHISIFFILLFYIRLLPDSQCFTVLAANSSVLFYQMSNFLSQTFYRPFLENALFIVALIQDFI